MLREKVRKSPIAGFIPGVWLITALLLFSCSIPEDFQTSSSRTESSGHTDFTASGRYGRVMILYSAGFNSLSQYLQDDIDELIAG